MFPFLHILPILVLSCLLDDGHSTRCGPCPPLLQLRVKVQRFNDSLANAINSLGPLSFNRLVEQTSPHLLPVASCARQPNMAEGYTPQGRGLSQDSGTLASNESWTLPRNQPLSNGLVTPSPHPSNQLPLFSFSVVILPST